MKPVVRPGELRHCIDVLENQGQAQDAHGQPIDDWQCIETVYAKVEPLTGRNIEYARQLYHLATFRITMYWTDKLTTNHRLQMGDRIFSIGSIVNWQERQRWLIALCSEGVVNG